MLNEVHIDSVSDLSGVGLQRRVLIILIEHFLHFARCERSKEARFIVYWKLSTLSKCCEVIDTSSCLLIPSILVIIMVLLDICRLALQPDLVDSSCNLATRSRVALSREKKHFHILGPGTTMTNPRGSCSV